MNRSMKQMLSALLAVAMVAALLVVPSVAANATDSSVYKLTADTASVTVKVGDSKAVAKGEYKVEGDTAYKVVADTDLKAEVVDTAVATAAVKNGEVKVTGVKAGTTTVKVTLKDQVANVTVKVEAEEPLPEGTYVLTADDVMKALAPDHDGTSNFSGAKEPYTTADGYFTVYPKWSSDDNAYSTALEIRPLAKWANADGVNPTWADGYVPSYVFRMDGGGNKTAEWVDKTAGTTKPFISNVTKFTVNAPATVTVWFVQKDAKGVALYQENNPVAVVMESIVGEDNKAPADKTACIATLKITEPGTYYLGGCNANGEGAKINQAKVMVVEEKAPVVTVDKTALESAVTTAEKVYKTAGDTYVIKADTTTTSQVTKGTKYVLAKDVKALADAIAAAKAVVDNKDATQADVDKAVTDLNAAVAAYNKAIKTGTKSTGSNGGSSSNRPSNRPGTDTEQPTNLPFTDVKADDWFYSSVKKAFDKGLMKGTSETTFAPNDKTTRAMVATVLFRMDGEKKTDVENLFNDVAADTWFTDAVAWAAEKGIVKGYDDVTFAPNDNVTREQLVVMLYRYANATVKEGRDLSAFTDAADVSEWAVEAMTWAVDKGIILGKGNATLDAKGLASRAEVCTILVRFLDVK